MDYFSLINIPVEIISFESGLSLHQDLSGELEADFVDSVKQFGILRPPLVRQRLAGGYEVVCGARRLKAARDIRNQAATSCLLLKTGLETSDLLLLIIEDQKLSGPLSVIEKARYWQLCRQMLDKQHLHNLLSAALGSRGYLERLLPLLGLEQPIRNDIHNGLISDHTGRELLSLNAPDRMALHQLFRKLVLNHNKQRRVIEMSHIIASQQECTFAELFSTWYPEYIDDSPIANPPQMTHLLLQDLAKRSAPMSFEAERRFTEQIAGLNLPPQCSLSHSKGFEQDTVTLSIDFGNFRKFILKWKEIQVYFSNEKA